MKITIIAVIILSVSFIYSKDKCNEYINKRNTQKHTLDSLVRIAKQTGDTLAYQKAMDYQINNLTIYKNLSKTNYNNLFDSIGHLDFELHDNKVVFEVASLFKDTREKLLIILYDANENLMGCKELHSGLITGEKITIYLNGKLNGKLTYAVYNDRDEMILVGR